MQYLLSTDSHSWFRTDRQFPTIRQNQTGGEKEDKIVISMCKKRIYFGLACKTKVNSPTRHPVNIFVQACTRSRIDARVYTLIGAVLLLCPRSNINAWSHRYVQFFCARIHMIIRMFMRALMHWYMSSNINTRGRVFVHVFKCSCAWSQIYLHIRAYGHTFVHTFTRSCTTLFK